MMNFIHDVLEEDRFSILNIATKENLKNMLTKALARNKFKY